MSNVNQDTPKAIARMIVPGSAVAKQHGSSVAGLFWYVKARVPGVKLLQFIDWIEVESRKEAIQIAEELNRLSGLYAKRGGPK